MNELDSLANKINAQVRGFYLDDGVVVQAIKYIRKENRVVFRRTDTGEEYYDDYKGSALFRKRVFIISEVARQVGRAAGTIRGYERSGLLPAASRFPYKKTQCRYYTLGDVEGIESFFNARQVGRPSKKTVYSRRELRDKIRNAEKGVL